MSEIISVEITCPDAENARQIADAAVGERLAACAHLHPPVESVYRWKGAIERARETLLVLETRADLFTQLAERVRALHPYELPSILARPVTEVTDDYRAWLIEETGDGSRTP